MLASNAEKTLKNCLILLDVADTLNSHGIFVSDL